MGELSLKKRIGQLLIVGFDGKRANEHIKTLIRDYNIGGVILFARNIGTPGEVLELTHELQSLAKRAGYEYPLLVCVDQENGIVRRLGYGATVFPGAMLLGAAGEPENAYEVGVATGKELKVLGINWNLAPVVDVNNNPLNPVIGVRAYGENPEQVVRFAAQALRGMKEAGMITTLKHFPGHGDTTTDSHLSLPVIPHSMERLEAIELVPYKALIDETTDVVMTSHVYFPAIEKDENIPATLSKAIITGLLREHLGFHGVVTTDCMEMDAIKKNIGTVEGAVRAIKAGVDLVMISHSMELQIGAIEEIFAQVLSGEIHVSTILASYERICTLKKRHLDWEAALSVDREKLDIVGCEDHRRLAERIYRDGITLCRQERGILPLSPEDREILLICSGNVNIIGAEEVKYSNNSLDIAFKTVNPAIDIAYIKDYNNRDELHALLEKTKSYRTIILGTISLCTQREQLLLINALDELGKNLIVIAMKSPYDLECLPRTSAYIAAYEYTYPALVMAAKAIYGLEEVKGKLPVTVRASHLE